MHYQTQMSFIFVKNISDKKSKEFSDKAIDQGIIILTLKMNIHKKYYIKNVLFLISHQNKLVKLLYNKKLQVRFN